VEVKMLLPDYYMSMDVDRSMPFPLVQTGREYEVIGESSSSPIGPNLVRVDSIGVDRTINIPPVRGPSSLYLSQYMSFGNGAYYNTLLYLLESGRAEVTDKTNTGGVVCYVVEVGGDGTGRKWELSLEEEYGLPLRMVEREELPENPDLGGYEYETVITDLQVNPGLRESDFDVDITSLYDVDPSIIHEQTMDMLCLQTTLSEAEGIFGFSPLVPEIEGFDLYGVYCRDWQAYELSTGLDPSQVQAGFFECYLLFRDPSGTRQVEVCEAREEGESGVYYYEEPMSYCICREEVSVYGGDLDIITFPFYQVGMFEAGDIRVTVSGDMSYRQLLDIAASMFSQGS
jgi:hypothetical protein